METKAESNLTHWSNYCPSSLIPSRSLKFTMHEVLHVIHIHCLMSFLLFLWMGIVKNQALGSEKWSLTKERNQIRSCPNVHSPGDHHVPQPGHPQATRRAVHCATPPQATHACVPTMAFPTMAMANSVPSGVSLQTLRSCRCAQVEQALRMLRPRGNLPTLSRQECVGSIFPPRMPHLHQAVLK